MVRSPSPSVALTIDPATSTALEAERAAWLAAKPAVLAFVVHDEASMQLAGAKVVHARERLKALESERNTVRAPLRQALDALDGLYADPMRLLKEIAATLRDKIAAYSVAVQGERQRAMLASAQTAAAGAVPTEYIPPPAAAEGVTVRQRWIGHVTDPQAVERGLCSPDPKKIAHVLSAYSPNERPHPMPGIVVELVGTATVRS